MDDAEIIGAEAAEPETVMTTLTDMDMIGMVAFGEDFKRAAELMWVLPVLNLSNYFYCCARYLQVTFGNYSIHELIGGGHIRRLIRRHIFTCRYILISRPDSSYSYEEQTRMEWKAIENMSSEQAMTEFIEAMDGINPDWRSLFVAPRSSATGLGHKVSTMLAEEEELSDEEKSVFDWCKEGRVKEVQQLLSRENVNIDQVDENGLTLLHHACDRGHLEVVTLLIELGVNMNALDPDSQTPLHYACSCEHLSVIRTLVERGSDINVMDKDGNTPADNTSREDIHQLLECHFDGSFIGPCS